METKLPPTLFALAALVAVPGTAAAHSRGYRGWEPPAGHVLVVNRSGGEVTVALPGVPVRHLAVWETADIVVSPGDTTLRATYLQFGADRLLESDRVFVTPGGVATVTLQPEHTARVLVTNDSPRTAQLLVDGAPNASFAPGETRLVPLRVGTAELQMVADGRPFACARLDLRPFAELRWEAEMPRTGTLTVSNPLPIPVQLVSSRGLPLTVAPYGTARFDDLPVGTFRVTARRVTGEYVDAETVEILPGCKDSWRVEAPRTGLVAVDSESFLGTELRVDGRTMARLAPDQDIQLELSVGWHEVEARDDRGRTLYETWIEVEPFDVARVRFGTPQHVQARDDHHHDHDGHGHDAYGWDRRESYSTR